MPVEFIFTRCPKHINKKLLRQALKFYADLLLPKLRRQINVTVDWTYSSRLRGAAEVAALDNTFFGHPARPNNFKMSIDASIRGWPVFMYAAHEMVHVKQWVMGELRSYATDEFVGWKGAVQRWVDTDKDGIEYWDAPWEIEARGLEDALYGKFKAHYGLKGRDLKALR